MRWVIASFEAIGVRLRAGVGRQINREHAREVSTAGLRDRQLEFGGRPLAARVRAVINTVDGMEAGNRSAHLAGGAKLGCHDVIEVGRLDLVSPGVKVATIY